MTKNRIIREAVRYTAERLEVQEETLLQRRSAGKTDMSLYRYIAARACQECGVSIEHFVSYAGGSFSGSWYTQAARRYAALVDAATSQEHAFLEDVIDHLQSVERRFFARANVFPFIPRDSGSDANASMLMRPF